MWQNEFIDLLNDQFQVLRRKNPRFSVRAFAKKVGLSPGSLSDTLKKKKTWQISADRACEILERIPVATARKNRLLVKMARPAIYPREVAARSAFEHLKNWAFYPILFSFDLPLPLREPKIIAERLGIGVQRAESVIEDLVQRKFLSRSRDGRLNKTDINYADGDGPSREEIRKYHATSLKLAEQALENIPAERRDFSTLTFAGDEKRLAQLREEIRKLHENASALMDEGDHNTHVFQLSVQVFPFDRKTPTSREAE